MAKYISCVLNVFFVYLQITLMAPTLGNDKAHITQLDVINLPINGGQEVP